MATRNQLQGHDFAQVPHYFQCSIRLGLTGSILRGYHASGAIGQAAALRAEGVTVDTSAMGELMVDFETYGWFPSVLPSYIAKGYVSNEDDDDL